MSIFSYIYQLKRSFSKFLYSNRTFDLKEEQTKLAQEVNKDFQSDLKLKCKRAALEIHYVRNFTHWPITKPKKEIEDNAIVYLDISRNKQVAAPQHTEENQKMIVAIDRSGLAKKVIVKKNIR